MTAHSTIQERVQEISHRIRSEAELLPVGADPLRSVFLIGSCSGAEVPADWYQDYDLHFLFDGLALRPESIAWLRRLLDSLVAGSDPTCRIEAFVKDRHWKMFPDRAWPANIGVHATLMNAADHYRRVHHNPILAFNMYTRCKVLTGTPPIAVRGSQPPTLADWVHSVGGIGWLAENFARTVALYCLMPWDRSFYPFIAGYCWNAASSALFHLSTLERGGVCGRTDALAWFVARVETPRALRDAVQVLDAHKEDPSDEAAFAQRQIDAAGLVIEYAGDCLAELAAVPASWRVRSGAPELVSVRALYPEWPDAECRVADVRLPDTCSGYLAAMIEALDLCRAELGDGLSPKENFEFLRDLVVEGSRPVRLRLWSRAGWPRRLLSHDFESSVRSIAFGWEDGIQALLQRLHEVCWELGDDDPLAMRLAEVAFQVAAARLRSLGWEPPRKAPDGPAATRAWVASSLKPFLPTEIGGLSP